MQPAIKIRLAPEVTVPTLLIEYSSGLQTRFSYYETERLAAMETKRRQDT
jgi:hypothetical protein